MVTYVTQNFQILDPSKTRKPPIYKRSDKMTSRMDIVPQTLANRLDNLDQPIVKYSAKPSMLLPKSVEQSPLEFFQSYNESVYELLVKSKRRAIIAKYNAAQAANSLRNDSSSALSDRMCSSYEDERLSSFLNNMTNKRRKTALAANRVKHFHSPTYETISQQKPLYPTSKPSSPTSQMTDTTYIYIDSDSKATSKPSTRPQTAMDSISSKLHSEIERPKTSQSMNRDNEIDHTIKYLKHQPKVQALESHEDITVDGIKLFTEKFIRITKPKEFLTSSPIVNLNKDENSALYKNISRLTKRTVNKDVLNEENMKELEDEEIKEIQANLDKKLMNINITAKPPSSPVDESHLNKTHVKTSLNKQIIENNNSAKFANTVDAVINTFIRPNSKKLTKENTRPNSSKGKKSEKKSNKKMKSKDTNSSNFLSAAITLNSVQNNDVNTILNDNQKTAENIIITSNNNTNNNNNIFKNNTGDLIKFREVEKRIKFNDKPTVFKIYENSIKVENNTSDSTEQYNIYLNSNHSNENNMNNNIEPQTCMGKLYNTGENKTTISSNSINNQSDNVNKLFLTKRVPLTSGKNLAKKEEKKEDSQFLYVKQSLIDMLEFELSEAKKEDINIHNVLSGMRDVKVNNSLGRLALSKGVCRFELPMDMKLLESMEPTYYLIHYCKINDRRKNFYKKVFDKYKIKTEKEDYIDLSLLEECLMDVHMRSINKIHYNMILNLVHLQPKVQINLVLFQGIAALSERVLYSEFVTDDTQDLPDYQKDKIECADFGSLKSKLEGVRISKDMLNLLQTL